MTFILKNKTDRGILVRIWTIHQNCDRMLAFSQRRKLSCFLTEHTTFEKEVFARFFEVLYFLKFFDFEKLLHEFYTIYLYHTLFPVNRIFLFLF